MPCAIDSIAGVGLVASYHIYVFINFPYYFSFILAAVIVSIYEDPVQPQQAASVVEKLGDYLITCGY